MTLRYTDFQIETRDTSEFVIRHFGKNHSRWLHDCDFGRNERPEVNVSEPKSRSRETTFGNRYRSGVADCD